LHPELAGRVDMFFDGEGDYPDDPVNISYRFKDASFYKDRVFQVEGSGAFYTDFAGFNLKIGGEIAYNGSRSPLSFNFNKTQEKYFGKFDLNLNEIDLLIPWKDNNGRFIISGEILTSEKGDIITKGSARFNGSTMNFPGFPHTLNEFQGRMEFADGSFDLKYLRGTMGGGEVTMLGDLKIIDGSVADLDIAVTGKDMNLHPMDRFSCRVNTNLTLNYEAEKLMLRGNIFLLSADWRREIGEKISFVTETVLSSSEYNFLKLLRYDLRISGNKNVKLNNSLAKAEGEFDLRLQGSMDFPRLRGFIESRGGDVLFANRKFNLIKGRLVFTDNIPVDPRVDIRVEGFIKNYRVNIDIGGTSDHFKPQLSSSPPLPSQEVMALISMGELFERSNSAELGTQVGSVGMLSMTITSELQKRAKKLLGIDLLEIKPDISSPLGEGKSKLTIGKSISKNFVILYSTNMSTSRKEMWYAKYLLSKNLSLIGMRNEEGKFSLEIRFRKRR
jgi:autotransporter translocation and assembly factor TamB